MESTKKKFGFMFLLVITQPVDSLSVG